MPFRHILVYTVLFLFTLYSCNSESDIPKTRVKFSNSSDYSVTDWKLIGPFLTDSSFWIKTGPGLKDSVNGEIITEFDNFESYGLSESQITSKQLCELKLINKNPIFIYPEKLEQDYHNAHGMIDLSWVTNTDKPGNLYAACILKSKKEQDIVFLTGGDESAKLYLNGDLIESPVQNPYRLVYQNYLFAHLKKGNNFLLLKTTNTQKSWNSENNPEPWRYILNICSPRKYNDYYLKLEKMFIKKPVVPFENSLEVWAPVHPIDSVKKVEIENDLGELVLVPDYAKNINISSLNFGLFNLILKTDKHTYKQDFYYGDIHHGIKPLYKKANDILQTTNDISLKTNLGALIKRYDILYEYYKGNYFKISESNNNVRYSYVDSVIINPTRLIKLQNPNYVKLETIKLWRNPIYDIQFFKKTENSYRQIHYLQTNNQSGLLKTKITDKNIITAKANNAFLEKLYFTFKEGDSPDYMQVVTNNSLASREIDRRFIFLYKEIQNILKAVEAKNEPFKNVPGTHLRGFVSDIEEKEQYYIVQSPNSIEKDTTPKPLVVVVPWVFNASYPFLRSFIVADVHVHEMYEWLLNERDFVVVHANARTFENIVTEPIAINNVLRTIEEVKKDYNIDTTRIHLFAYCGGSELATSLATKFPSKFASLGIVAGFALHPSNKWMKNNYAINFTENLNNIPTLIKHGELDEHTPLGSMQQFVDIAKQNGNKYLTFEIEPELSFEAYPRLRHHEEMFTFFAKNKVPVPDNITFSTSFHKYNKAYWLNVFPLNSGEKVKLCASVTNNTITINTDTVKKISICTDQAPFDKTKSLKIITNGILQEYNPPFSPALNIYSSNKPDEKALQKNEFTEGPLLDVFANRFILVKSSTGSQKENTLCNKLIEEFCSMWEKYYYVRPIVKKDIDITNQDYLESNLVLFGNQHSNKIFNKIYSQLPVNVTKSGISLGEKNFEGKSMGYVITYPNPLNQKKYVVLIGGNNLSLVKLRKGNPARNGYYDYEIYKYDTEYQYILEQGIFNENWSLN